MRRLWLLRHAKSSWGDARIADIDRPLSERGRRAAAALAEHCKAAGIRPDLVLCSSAVRARETLAAVLPGLGEAMPVSIEEALYTFDADHLLVRLRQVPDDAGSVLLVGHNPGIGVLAADLAVDGRDSERLNQKYPTGGLVSIDLDVNTWTDIGKGRGHLNAFVTPGDLGGR